MARSRLYPISPVGARILEALNGRPQRWLCSATDLPPQTVSGVIVRGKMPAADTAILMARALGVSVEWLVLGEQPNPPAPARPSIWRRLRRFLGAE